MQISLVGSLISGVSPASPGSFSGSTISAWTGAEVILWGVGAVGAAYERPPQAVETVWRCFGRVERPLCTRGVERGAAR